MNTTPLDRHGNLDEKAMNLAEVFSQSGLPILAIVDENGKFVGTLRERELVRRLASIQESYFLEAEKREE